MKSNIISILKNALSLQGQVVQILHNSGATGDDVAEVANEILKEVAKSGLGHPIWSAIVLGGECDCEACADKKDDKKDDKSDDSAETTGADKNEQKFDLGNGVEATVVAIQVGADGIESSVDMNSLPPAVRKMAEEMVKKMRTKMDGEDKAE
jgi:hypothetical protein